MSQQFEDLKIWQKSKDLALQVYTSQKNNRDFAFRDQVQRAAVSVMNNIAEGFERKSDKEYLYFLTVAKGSAGEVRSMASLASELKYMTAEEVGDIEEGYTELSRMISGMISAIQKP